MLFGILFLRESVPDCYADLGFRTVSTNPCGEIPLCPYDSCRLLAINLYSYVENPFTSKAKFNFELFSKHVRLAQRIMDDIIDLELEKIDKILAKIESDPEDDNVKLTEYQLWQKSEQNRFKVVARAWELLPKEICWLLWACVTAPMKPPILQRKCKTIARGLIAHR